MQTRWLILCICIAVLGVPAFADITIDFAGAPAGPAGNVTGTATTLTANNIVISSVLASGSQATNCLAGCAVTGTNPVGGAGVLSINATGGSFNAVTNIYTYTGGTYNITGTVPSLAGPPSGALL